MNIKDVNKYNCSFNKKTDLASPLSLFSAIDNNISIIVAVSGGPDSMCLLYLLNSIKIQKKLNLIVAHVNHCLRGMESDEDEAFVKEIAQKNNLKFESVRIDVKKLAKKLKKGIEETARIARYDFFYKLADEYSAKIVTAHSLSDSIETMFLNLIRGSSPKGLRGILPVNGIIYRPLINISKDAILSYCKEQKIQYREDSTNGSNIYTRNRIRHALIPLCKQINPNFEVSAARLMSIISEDEDNFFSLKVKELKKQSSVGANKYRVSTILKSEKAIITRFIADLIVENSLNIDFKKVNIIYNMLINSTGVLELSKLVYVKISNDILSINKLQNEYNKHNIVDIPQRIKADIPFYMQSDNICISIDEFTLKDIENIKDIPEKEFHNLIDCDRINASSLFFRKREPGDKFRPLGRNLHKSFKKLMQDCAIPERERFQKLVLSGNNSNNLIWIEGVGVSGDFSVLDSTKHAALVTVSHIQPLQQ